MEVGKYVILRTPVGDRDYLVLGYEIFQLDASEQRAKRAVTNTHTREERRRRDALMPRKHI